MIYEDSLDTLLTAPLSEYSRAEFFLLMLVLLALAVVFMMIWRRH